MGEIIQLDERRERPDAGAVALERLGRYWLEHLTVESAIPLDVVLERGYSEARSVEELEALGFTRNVASRNVGGLIVPWHGVDGVTVVHQLRVRNPQGGQPKYLFPAGSSPVLHCRPSLRGLLDDAGVPLWITEGAKQADAFPGLIVDLQGVWNFAVATTASTELLPDWGAVALRGREVVVCYDSDVMVKMPVQTALSRLVDRLTEAGAEVKVVYLPDPDSRGVGLDDYMAAGGTYTELVTMAQPFRPVDVLKERLSRKPELAYRIGRLAFRLKTEDWSMRSGPGQRDVYHALCYLAALEGKQVEGAMKVRPSQRTLAELARMERKTVGKNLKKLEERGLVRVDGRGVNKGTSPFLVLPIDPAQTYPTLGGQAVCSLPAPSHTGVTLSAPTTVRNSYTVKLDSGKAPDGLTFSERRERPGKRTAEAISRIADTEARSMRLDDLAFAMRLPRVRNLTRKGGVVERMVGWGIAEVEDGVVKLVPDWRSRMDEARVLTEEVEADARQKRRHLQERRAYAIWKLWKSGQDLRTIADTLRMPVEQVERFLAPAEEEAPLMGTERVERIVREDRENDARRRVEAQRRKVGTTAATFLSDELERAVGVRWSELRTRWTEMGADEESLRLQVPQGPYEFRREGADGNRLYVYRQDRKMAAMVTEEAA